MEKLYRIFFFTLISLIYSCFNFKSYAQALEGDVYSRRECQREADFRVKGGVPPYTYIWTFDGDPNPVQVDENLDPTQLSILTLAKRGTYNVTAVDANGQTFSDTFIFSGTSNFNLDVEILEENECDGITYGRIIGTIDNGVSPFTVTIYNEVRDIVFSSVLPGNIINLSGYPAGSYLIEVQNANGCIELDEVELEEIEPIDFEEGDGLGAFPVTCEDNGTISYNVIEFVDEVRFRIRRAAGGYVNPWTVAPNGEIRYDGLPVGDYILEISDRFRLENCPEELPFSIIDEVLLTFEFDATGIGCFGENDGSILFEAIRNFTEFDPLPTEVRVTITNAGGTIAYNNISVPIGASNGLFTFDNLAAGTYTVTTSHGGTAYPECIQSNTITIPGPTAPLQANGNPTNITCFGLNNGSASVTVDGGWGGYTFLWNNGATTSQINNLPPGNYHVDITDEGGCTIREEINIIGPPSEITANVEVLQDLTCVGSNDGIARISNISGGYGGYTIQWGVGNQTSETAVDLPSGSINVIVTDSGGCSRTFVVNVGVPPAPNVILDESNVSCFGGNDGSVRIRISGSDSYTINIAGQTRVGNDETFTNLQAGNYIATITYGASCSITRSVTIGSPARVIINRSNAVVNNISCFGLEDGSISGLTASGGTGSLTVQWQKKVAGTFEDISGETSFSISNLAEGEYKIIVTDENGCFDEFEYGITEPNTLNVSAPSTTPVTCFNGTNGSVSFTVSGGRMPYAYSLNGGAFTLTSNGNITIPNLPAGAGNTIEVRDDSGCSVDSFTFDINSAPQIQLDFVASYPETCFGQQNGSIEINYGGGSGNLKVEWYRAGDFSTIISTNQNLNNVGPGSYTVRVIDLLDEFCFAQDTFTISPTPELNLALDGSPTNILCFGESTGAININASGGTGDLTYSWTGPNGFASSQQNINGIPAGQYRVRVTDANGCFKELVDILVQQPETGIQINTLNTTAPSCPDSDDGSIQMQVFGGAPAYNISWQRENNLGVFENFPGMGLSLIGIPSGKYKILVSDSNGCGAEQLVDLVGPDDLVINVLSTEDVSCNGRNDGRINIQVTGGTFPYFYQWDHGFINQNPTNLSAGLYNVTVTDARGCVIRLENIEITQPDPIMINILDVVAPSCEFDDGRIEVEFIGGDASYTSRWYRLPENTLIAENTANLENITPGIYRVEYTNGTNCEASRIITVAGPANPLELNISAQDPTCDNANGIIAISASGGRPGYQYFIELNGVFEILTTNIISNLQAGTYPVKVIDSEGCEVVKIVEIQNPNQPVYEIEKIQDVSCFGGNDGAINFETFGDFTGITFQWFKRELAGTLTAVDVNNLYQLIAGVYFVRFTYDNACTLDSENITISEPDEINILSNVTQLICFDDLGSFSLTISGGSAGKTISISSPNGYSNTTSDVISGTFTFDGLAPGIYNWIIEDVGCGPITGLIEIFDIQRPEFELTKTDILCFGESTGILNINNILLETGRTYNVFLNGVNRGIQTNFTNLSAGIYNIQLIDNQGCESIFQTIEITQPERPLEIINLIKDDVSCFDGNDGSVSFEILGGTATYSFTLSGNNGYSTTASNINESELVNFNDLPAGNYLLEVLDENGNCQSSTTFQITQPTALIFDIEVGEVACPGGTTFIRLLLSGGTTPYSFTWEQLNSTTGNWVTLTETSNQLQNISAGSYRYTATDAENCEIFTEIIEIEDGLPVAIDFSAGEILCFGGNALVELTASRTGSTNFTFFVNGNQIFGKSFPAVAGVYQVYALDNVNGCTSDEIQIEITQPAAPLSFANFNSQNLGCFESNDGEISFIVQGGTAPYTIRSTGEDRIVLENEIVVFTDLLANTAYGFDITDANGCTLTIPPVVLSQPLPIQVNSTFTPILCFGGDGSISVQATGGRVPFSITWSYSADGIDYDLVSEFDNQFTINGLKSGFYTYTLTDSGACPPLSETIELTQPSETILDFDVTDVSCFQGNDGSISFTPSGGPASSYQIFFNGQLINGNQINGLSAGVYEAFAVSGGCPSEVINITISEPAEPLSVIASFPNSVLCHNDLIDISISITGGNGIYEVNIGQGFLPVDPTGIFNFENILPGTYTLEVRDQKGCIWTETISIANPMPLQANLEILEDVSCHNGNDGNITVSAQGGTGNFSYTWRDNSGNTIGSGASIENLSVGLYTVLIQDQNGCEIIENYEIRNIDPISISTESVTSVTCNGQQNGGFTIVAAGGTPGYSLFVDGVRYNSLAVSGLMAGVYDVYAEDAKGCISPTIQVEISQPDPLILEITKSDITCFGANDGTTQLNFSGGTGPYSIRWSDGNTSLSRTNLLNGNYEVVVIDANGCLERANIQIIQPNPINATGQVVPVSCFGGNDGSINLNISGGTGDYTVRWIAETSGQEIGTGSTLSNISAGAYQAEITDENGCVALRSFIVPEPFEPLTVTPFISNIRCAGETNGRIDLIVTGGTGPYLYSWSSGENTRSITNKPAGVYEVEITDSKGCVLIETYEIQTPEPIQILTSELDQVSCKFGTDGRISLDISGGTGSYQVQWSNGQQGTEINNLRAGVYSVFVFDENTCFASEIFIISEPAEVLSVSAISTSELCNPDDILEVLLDVKGGTAPYTYLWSNGATSQNLTNISPGLFAVEVTDANGCIVETEVEVKEPAPSLQLTLEGTTAICASGSRAEVTANVTGGVAPYTYSWSTGSSSPTQSNLVPGMYTLTVTDAAGCSIIENIEIFPPLNLAVRLDDVKGVSCFGGNDGSISISIDGGLGPFEIEWSHGLIGQTTASGLKAGNYSVTVKDATGCSTIATYNIREPELLTFTETVENITCHDANNGSIQLDVRGGTAPYTYRWSNGFNGRNPRNLAPGMYTVVITDRNGCSTGGSFGISQPEPLRLESNFSEDLLCFGDAQGFININISGGIQPYKIIWSDEPELESFNRSNLLAGSYKVTVIDDNNCIIEKSFDIKEPRNLDVRLMHRFDVDCENKELTGIAWLEIQGGKGDYDVWWYNGDQNKIETTFFNSGEISAIIIDENGCQVEVSEIVEMPLVFSDSDFTFTIPSLGTKGEILVNDQINFIDRTLGNVIAWEWSFGDGNNSTDQNPTHTYRRPGKYTITLKTFDIYGCISEAKIDVEVLASYRIMIPNAFSPNKDGINDVFFPKMRGIASFEFYIFNKWGELIYSNLENQDEGWDGRLNGTMSPNGNYVYKLVFIAEDGETGSQTGVFTLVN